MKSTPTRLREGKTGFQPDREGPVIKARQVIAFATHRAGGLDKKWQQRNQNVNKNTNPIHHKATAIIDGQVSAPRYYSRQVTT